MDSNIVEQLIRDEGIEYRPYLCTSGKTTIGVGRNLDDKGLSHDEIMMLFHNDLRECEKGVNNCLHFAKHLDDERLAVLVNMAFNMGIGGLLKFTNTLKAVAAGDYVYAAKEMLDSKWARGPTKNRANRLARQMESGEWV